MTIAALLSAHGVRAPRYITPDGRTIFDNVIPTATGYAHPDYGHVTKVSNHTFHDGPRPEDTPAEQWWQDDELLNRHIDDMARSFPNFTYCPPDEDTLPAWIGAIDTGRGSFKVGIVLRYDQRLPFVTVLHPKRLGKDQGRHFKRSPHLYDSGDPCIAAPSDWNPAEHTAATATAWLAHWLAAYTEWRITNKWPIEGVDNAA